MCLFPIIYSSDCTSNEPTKEEIFKNFDKNISSSKINSNFTWKDKEVSGYKTIYPYLNIVFDWEEAPIRNVFCSAINDKVGIIVETDGNRWSVDVPYTPDKKMMTITMNLNLK